MLASIPKQFRSQVDAHMEMAKIVLYIVIVLASVSLLIEHPTPMAISR